MGGRTAAGGDLGGDTVEHRPKWSDQHKNTLGHRRGRPSAHEAVHFGRFAGERTAGRPKVAVQEAVIGLVERNREQVEPADRAEQRVMWTACVRAFAIAGSRPRNPQVIGRWAGPEAILAGERFIEAGQLRGVDSSEGVKPVDSSEINESLPNGHQTWGDGWTARLQDYALVNYFNVGSRIDR
jgi:hypothetical protein